MEIEKWVIEVNNEVESMPDTLAELEQWKKTCIYRLPAYVTDLDDKAYKPQIVSLGPYHQGKPHLKPMDEHKHRALLHFLKRSEKPLQLYVEALAQSVQELKDAYDQLDPVWQDDNAAFLKMMVLDGCFIFEILRMDTSGYAPNDPLFNKHGQLYMLPFLRQEMLLLENQVPLLVLSKLLAVENKISRIEPHEYANNLILRFYSPGTPLRSLGNCLHILDVYRKSLIYGDPRRFQMSSRYRPSHPNAYDLIPSARELQNAGIRFKKSKFANLRDISFHGKTLRLPNFIVDTDTKSILLNLIAFERFHVGAGNEITSYVCFLYNLIRDPTDVRVLSSHGIISNCLGSDLEVASLFNLVSQYVTVDPESSLDIVHLMVSEKLRNRFTRTMNEWQSEFIRTYFKSPWAVIFCHCCYFAFLSHYHSDRVLSFEL
ncbi:UNVERIFIED_CONTAM: hypothetical protein Sangu_1812900 [Sesamum angustifolium]|uniref:Uncharacterized protein n=1 Tax=Sesamum angustifolium TaxID=2727405 RepID=A0AAW2M788_9LAMI